MNTKTTKRFLVAVFLCVSSVAATQTEIPHAFQAGQPARATEVNENFAAIVGAIDQVAADVSSIQAVESQLSELQAQVVALTARLTVVDTYVSRLQAHIDVLEASPGVPTVRVSGANLQVVNGLNATASVNGVGNLIVGYDEAVIFQDESGQTLPSDKSGSHNLVIGYGHSYLGYGGLISGDGNRLAGAYANIVGGSSNWAERGAIIGGAFNYIGANGVGSAIFGSIFALAEQSEVSICNARDWIITVAGGRYCGDRQDGEVYIH